MKPDPLGLEKRVLDARLKRNKRLRINYHLARAFGYTAEESTLIMNQSWRNIIANAIQDDRIYLPSSIPAKYEDFVSEQWRRYYNGTTTKATPKDVTELGGKD
jgi:hypothetical protein